MEMTPGIKKKIVEGASSLAIHEQGVADGLITLEMDGVIKAL
jgi:hypothetical protein